MIKTWFRDNNCAQSLHFHRNRIFTLIILQPTCLRGKIITSTKNNTRISLSLQGDIIAVNERLDKICLHGCKLRTPNFQPRRTQTCNKSVSPSQTWMCHPYLIQDRWQEINQNLLNFRGLIGSPADLWPLFTAWKANTLTCDPPLAKLKKISGLGVNAGKDRILHTL